MNTNKDTNQGFVYCSDQNLQPGDIVLTSDDTITSAIIKSTTGGELLSCNDDDKSSIIYSCNYRGS